MNEPVLSPQIRQVMEALEANNMTAHYLPRADQVVAFVQQLIPEGAVVSNGGSVTLAQTGVMDHLASGRYQYLDRSKGVHQRFRLHAVHAYFQKRWLERQSQERDPADRRRNGHGTSRSRLLRQW